MKPLVDHLILQIINEEEDASQVGSEDKELIVNQLAKLLKGSMSEALKRFKI